MASSAMFWTSSRMTLASGKDSVIEEPEIHRYIKQTV